MNPWILAARPRTLGAAIVPVMAGCALAFSAGAFDPMASALALTCAILIQIATNYFNDAIDHVKGADTAERLGPVRATSAGLLSARAMMAGGAACLILATILAIPLVLHGGWPILTLGIVSLFLAYAYTGGPFPLPISDSVKSSSCFSSAFSPWPEHFSSTRWKFPGAPCSPACKSDCIPACSSR